jgi:hypothetical protein
MGNKVHMRRLEEYEVEQLVDRYWKERRSNKFNLAFSALKKYRVADPLGDNIIMASQVRAVLDSEMKRHSGCLNSDAYGDLHLAIGGLDSLQINDMNGSPRRARNIAYRVFAAAIMAYRNNDFF